MSHSIDLMGNMSQDLIGLVVIKDLNALIINEINAYIQELYHKEPLDFRYRVEKVKYFKKNG